jgi:hypothetical protein
MTALKSLTFTTLPKPSVNPTLDRRAKMVIRLDEQKRLLADSAYTRTVRSLKKNEAGEPSLFQIQSVSIPFERKTHACRQASASTTAAHVASFQLRSSP